MRVSLILLASGLASVLASCAAPEDDVTFRIESSLVLTPPTCLAEDAVARDDVIVLDIGLDANSANSAIAVVELEIDDAAVVGVNTSETVMHGALDGAPRRLGAGGAIINADEQSPRDIVFVTLVTREDAVALQEDAAVRAALGGPDDRMRVDVDLVLEAFLSGVATGADTNERDRLPPPSSPSGTIRTPPFTLGVDLCAGCLIPRCSEDEVAVPVDGEGTCFRGQDAPFTCERTLP